ncbi:TonB-dependent receptor [Pseudomonas aeruginosa]|nr:TonB-dependent receptor [Pseudomonas aeruginosa]MEC6485566.1 TonB-dependent receptor [Pseudomonas aeruginosa]NPT02601.1 TonB-dependent receptor [Pseudomonas aeruginosa]QKE98346.1 TonB-dependent receptor [Pseudomonas aeruginosa]HBO1307487.1 TonB-dependent receptor [Pseudomonas aeruginosa]HDQ4578796.1 TonB-dependent receptor [Pseudomonas aeruginosa]
MCERQILSRALSASALAGVLQLSFPAGAAAPLNDEESVVLDSITVTARKREENLNDVPGSVHVETGRDLERKRMLDGAAALRDVAGASVGIFGDRSNAFVVLRGVAPILTPLSPDDSSVLTFVDGAPMPIGASFSPYLDLERMEVMKGPQNTLFGRNTSGGAINLVPVKPNHEFEASVRGEAGTDGIFRTEAIINGSLIPETLSARLALRRSGADGYINNVAGRDLGEERTWAARGSVLFTPSSRVRWLLSAQGESTDSAPTAYIAYRPGGAKTAAQNKTIDDIRMYALSSRLEYDFDDMTVTAQTSYARLNDQNDYNFPDARIASDFSGLPPEQFLNPATNFIDWRKRDSRLTQEFRLGSLPGADIGWLAGVVFYQDRARRDRTSEMWYFGPSASGSTDYDLKTTGQALFGEATIPLNERLQLTVGARATREDKDFHSEYHSNGAEGAVPYFRESGSEDYRFLTGRTSLSYRWTDDLMTYASVSRGYKSGGFGLGNSLMWSGVPREPYDSSTVMSYELGMRSNWLDDSLVVNGALFFNDMSKEQMQSWDYENFTGKNLNLDARSAGFELDARYRASRNWWMEAGVAYTYSSLRHVSAEAAALQDGLRSGNRLPSVPEWTARTALGYEALGRELGFSGWLAEQRVNAMLTYNFVGSRFTDASNFGRLAPVHLISARLGIDWGDGEFYLFGDNLLDKRYMTIKDRFGTDPQGQPVYGVSYARGATLGVGMVLRF